MPKKLSVWIDLIDTDRLPSKPIRFSLSCPMVEAGLFVSTPVAPGGTRAQDFVSKKHPKETFGQGQGTFIICFIPAWNGYELSAHMRPTMLACVNETETEGLRLFASGTAAGRVTAEIRTGGRLYYLQSDSIPTSDKVHAVTLRWSGGVTDLLVNGWRVYSAEEVPFPQLDRIGDTVFFGCDPTHQHSGLFAGLTIIQSHDQWLEDSDLQAFLFKEYPRQFPHFRHSIASEDRVALQCFRAGSWAFPLARRILAFPDRWQEFPPPWLLDDDSLDEGNFRDEIARALGSLDDYVTREADSASGRTDLLVSTPEGRLRCEFKIWNRHDYRDVPEKPLKYFTSSDRGGIVMMINPNRRKRVGDEYRQNVWRTDTNCQRLIDLPFGAEYPDHFVTTHQHPDQGEVEILHLVFDRYGPFAE